MRLHSAPARALPQSAEPYRPDEGQQLSERLPIDAVKLDASFVAKVASSSRSRALMAALLQFAAALDLGVIAEGVERADQVRVLRDLHVGMAQGRYFGAPLPLESALQVLGRSTLPRSA